MRKCSWCPCYAMLMSVTVSCAILDMYLHAMKLKRCMVCYELFKHVTACCGMLRYTLRYVMTM
jgi:hypothetical protein